MPCKLGKYMHTHDDNDYDDCGNDGNDDGIMVILMTDVLVLFRKIANK